VEYKVTITLDGSRSDALQKALAVTRISTILHSVVEVDIGEGRMCQDFRWVHKIPYLFSPTLFTLVKAIPTMRQLHTLRLSRIFLAQAHLCCILSSPYLTHLVLDAVQMPNISKLRLSPPKLRKLTTVAMYSWEAIAPLLIELAASLEYYELHECHLRAPGQLQLPPFPSLRKLRYDQNYFGLFDDTAVLNALLRASQVTHLQLSGWVDYRCIATSQKSLQHLSIDVDMLTEQILGTDPFPRLMSLSIQCHRSWKLNQHFTISSFIRDYFPEITLLHLSIPWSLRRPALVIARSQDNVQALELSVVTKSGLDWEESRLWSYEEEVPTDYFRNSTFPAVLQSLKVDVAQTSYELERSVPPCTRWISDNILPPVTGLGGSDLKYIDVSFVQPKSVLERERVISKRWVKSPDDDWQIEECL